MGPSLTGMLCCVVPRSTAVHNPTDSCAQLRAAAGLIRMLQCLHPDAALQYAVLHNECGAHVQSLQPKQDNATPAALPDNADATSQTLLTSNNEDLRHRHSSVCITLTGKPVTKNLSVAKATCICNCQFLLACELSLHCCELNSSQ